MAVIKWKDQEQIEQERIEIKEQQRQEEEQQQSIENAPLKIQVLEEENINLMLAVAELYEKGSKEV